MYGKLVCYHLEGKKPPGTLSYSMFYKFKIGKFAAGWKVRCAEFFPYSTYFEGSQSSATPNSALNQICKTAVNGTSSHSLGDHVVEHVASNGKLDTFKDLTI